MNTVPPSDQATRDAGRAGRIALGVALAAMVIHVAMELAFVLLRDRLPRAVWHEVAALGLSLAAAIAVCLAWRSVIGNQRMLYRVMAQLRESQQRFSGIVSIAADAIITVDRHGTILLFNDGAEAIFGWPAREMLGRSLEELLPARYHDAHRRHMGRFERASEVARRMGERQEIVGRRRDGSEFPAEATISRLMEGDRVLFTVMLRDITERRRQLDDERFLVSAGQSLSASLDYESTLLSAVHVAIPHLADCCLLDLVGEFGTTRRLASVHEDPEHTRLLRALEHRRVPISDAPIPLAKAIESRGPVRVAEIPADWATSEDPVAVALATLGARSLQVLPLVARGRSVGALTLISTDPSRHMHEDRSVADSVAKLVALAIDNATLYQTAQRANVARDEVLGVVSHDLRNPLSAIAMCARVLRGGTEQANADRVELLDAIIESTAMMNTLIQDLLDVSVIDSGHLRVDPARRAIGPLVGQAADLMERAAAERGVELRTTVPPGFPDVLVDDVRFVQVLSNLLGNSLKFTDAGGRIRVAAEVIGEDAHISVSDTGIGIPASHLPHIFDRHWHAKRAGRTGGTGLGLAIARGIVEAHGGRLRVDSTEGVGTTFTFTIPVAPQAAAPIEPSVLSGPAANR